MRGATQGEKAALVQKLRKEGYELNDLLDATFFLTAVVPFRINGVRKGRSKTNEEEADAIVAFRPGYHAEFIYSMIDGCTIPQKFGAQSRNRPFS